MSFPTNTPRLVRAVLAARAANQELVDAVREEIPIGSVVKYTTGFGKNRKDAEHPGTVKGYRGPLLQLHLYTSSARGITATAEIHARDVTEVVRPNHLQGDAP